MKNHDDPFSSSSNLCHVSSSQEEELKKCRFALEGSDSDTPLFGSDPVDSPIESTEIFLVSPPESPTSQNDAFLQQSTLSVGTEKLTELQGDNDGELGCVERIAKSMTKLNSPFKLFGVLGGESGLKDCVGEQGDGTSNVNKLNCSCNGGQETPEVGRIEEMGTEDDGLKSVEIENAVGDGWKEIHQETPARRKLQFSTQVVESHDGGSNADNGVERTSYGEQVSNAKSVIKNIDEIEKFRYVRPGNVNANEKDKDPKGKRMLPASILENSGEIEKKAHHDQNAAEVNEGAQNLDENSKDDEDSWEFLKCVLKMLSRRSNSNYAPNLENMNILEVAKMCGMNFP